MFVFFKSQIFKIINDLAEYYPDQVSKYPSHLALSKSQWPAFNFFEHFVSPSQGQPQLSIFSFCWALGNPNMESKGDPWITWVIYEWVSGHT